VALLLTAVAAAVQAPPRGDEDRRADIEFTGCVSLTPAETGEFTFVDGSTGSTYRLSGRGIHKYAGRRVAVVSRKESHGLRIRFGLWPSANVAGRAGDIDPAQASIARQPGGGAGRADAASFPELRVERMRGVDGICR
jgi:hypothetical protein